MKKYFITITILILFWSSAFAADINVTTPVTATTINTAIASASPGDNVIIPDGTYSNLGQIEIPSNIDGTEANPITLKPATAGGVTFSGNPAGARVMFIQGDWWIIRDFKFVDISETSSMTYGLIIRDAAHTRITNNYFDGFGASANFMNRPIWIGNGGSGHNTRIDYNTFTANRASDITISATYGGAQASNCQIDHNYFNETRTDWYAGIHVGSGDSLQNNAIDLYTIVEYNLFKNMTDGGTPISNKSSSNTYRYNVFRQVGVVNENCLTLRMGDDCTIKGNYFFDIRKQSIRVHGTGHKIINNYFENPDYSAILLAEGDGGGTGSGYANVSDIFIANNTIINPIYRGIHIGWWPSGDVDPANLTFKNNIIISDVTGSYLIKDSGHTGTFTWTTNLHYATGSANYWQNNGGGNEPGSGITHADPSLITGYGIYRLQAGSANAIEDGTPDGNVTDDIDGHSRDGTNPDIGCDEYSASAPTRLPVEEHDVGVSWLRLKIFEATPVTEATGVPITIDLNWTNPNEENTNDGYFKVGACPCDAGDSVWTNQAHKTSYDPPSALAYNTAHCWRVDIDHDGGTETGTDYGFTTTSQVNPPTPEGSGMVWHKSGAAIVHHVKGLEIQ